MNNSISKSVLVIVAAGVVLIAATLWFGLGAHKKSEPDSPPDVAQNADSSPVPAPAPKTASPPAKPAVAAVPGNGDMLAVIPISLTNLLVDAEVNADSAMKALPTGTQVYGGIEFWLQGAIHLQGLAMQDQNKNFRKRVVVPLDETNVVDGKISVNERGKNIGSIYLLGGTRYSAEAGEKFADVLWHYADGTTARSGLQYHVHLRDWARNQFEDPAQLPNALTKVAWKGPHPTQKTRSIRLYRLALVNTHPEKTLRSLEFVSAMKQPSLLVAALTLDPLLPGARPDDLTAEEFPDPELHGHLELLVEDGEGHPLPNAKVTATTSTKEHSYLNRKFMTDDSGTTHVSFADSGLDFLDVSAEHDGFSGRKMRWEVSGGDSVPASYTLKLGAEVKIGGVVVNESGVSVPGAEIRLYRFWRGGEDDPNKPGDRAAFGSQQQTTDADGRWQAGGLPAALLANIGFEIKHPDYLRAQDNIGDNSATEKQLRDGTYKTTLKRGLTVHGLVVDSAGNPVPTPKVWAGRRYYSDRKETTGDDSGHFSFANIGEGEVMFSASARGFAIAAKTVTVSVTTPEIVLRLEAGNLLRGHVQDESGQPVGGAQLGLENNGMDSLENSIEFSTRSDSNGDFQWDSAPNQALTFYVFHDGFEAKRDARLAPNQDNVITLRRSRTLQGVVLDATNGQPVTKFTVRTGKVNGGSDDVYGIIRYKSFTAADGHFSLTLEEEEDNAVLAMADGYADTVEKFPAASDQTIQVVIRMKPAASLSGVVLAPDGSPAPNVTVATSSGDGSPRHYVQLTGGRLRSYDSATKVATTDDQGRFKLGSAPDDGSLVAAGDPGFVRVPLAGVKNNPTVMLQAWGRIEGVLHSGGQPSAGKDLLFNLDIPGIGTDFNAFKVTTDEQGGFTMEKIPPGDGNIVRLIKTSPNSWSHSDSTAVTVKPGETTQVTLGDNGAVIIGSIRYGFQPTNESPLNLQGYLSSAAPMPPVPKFNSSEESRAFFQSPEWRAAMKERKNYSVELKPDGSFTVENVVPGNYSLNFNARAGGDQAWRNPPIAQGSTQISVPDSFDPAQPLNAGEVLLNPVPPPSVTPQTIWR